MNECKATKKLGTSNLEGYSNPTLFLPRLNTRVVGQSSRLYFRSDNTNAMDKKYFQFAKFPAKMKNVHLKHSKVKLTSDKNVNNIIEPKNKVSIKDLRLLTDDELNGGLTKSERQNLKKIILNCDECFFKTNSDPYPNSRSTHDNLLAHSVNLMHSHTDLHDESLWTAFDNLQATFIKRDSIHAPRLKIIPEKKNFAFENTQIKKFFNNKEFSVDKLKTMSENLKEKLLEKAKIKNDKILINKNPTSFKLYEKKLNKLVDRLKKIEIDYSPNKFKIYTRKVRTYSLTTILS